MKPYRKALLVLVILVYQTALFAQSLPPHLDSLMKAGVILNDQGKFAEAIAKYEEVLKAEPNNMTALYEKGFSLSAAGKNDEAIPCFETVIASHQLPNAYVALANIYDNRSDFAQAEKYYQQGIAVFPNYGGLWYNLGLSYVKQKKYAQAESAAVESIKINPKHAGSYQVYGYSTYFQGKTAMALMCLSNFLLFNPPQQQARVSAIIVKQILSGAPNPQTDPVAKAQQETIAKAVASSLAGKTNLKPVDSVNLELTSAFKAIKDQSGQYNSTFFARYFGDFFGAIGESNNMDVFTHVITVSLNPQENLAWLKAHPDDIKAFNTWLTTQKRMMN